MYITCIAQTPRLASFMSHNFEKSIFDIHVSGNQTLFLFKVKKRENETFQAILCKILEIREFPRLIIEELIIESVKFAAKSRLLSEIFTQSPF